jgi:hypothetical protein
MPRLRASRHCTMRLEPPDFHGVFGAFLRGPSGLGWYMFDPTRRADPQGIVRIGIGRDAAEVAFCSLARWRLTSRRSVSADPWMFRRPRRRRSVLRTADTDVGGHFNGERRRLTIGPGFPECLISPSQSIGQGSRGLLAETDRWDNCSATALMAGQRHERMAG